MKVLILNGPNLNLLGKRQPEIYGGQTFELYFEGLKAAFPSVGLSYFQSNSEGDIVTRIQEAGYSLDGIVLNAAGYTHTSVAIADAVAAVPAPVVEVHVSNVFAREAFRHRSYLSPVCVGTLTGFGLRGYEMALRYLLAEHGGLSA